MLLPSPPKYPRRKRIAVAALVARPAPPAPVTVAAVDIEQSDTLLWTFSSDISAVHGRCAELLATDRDGGEFVPPDSVLFTAPFYIEAQYKELDFEGFAAWQIVETPSGIVFVNGALVVPENGTSG